MVKLPKHININNYLINLINDKQLLYSLIYNLEFEMLKIYVKTDLANSFIRLSKLFTNASIIFIYKKILTFNYISISKILIIQLFKIGICCHWLVSCLIVWPMLNILPIWIWQIYITKYKSKKKTSKKWLFKSCIAIWSIKLCFLIFLTL